MRFLFVTDLHLRETDVDDFSTHVRIVDAGLNFAGENWPDAEFCVIGGDISDDGTRSTYRWLKTRLQSLPFPSILIPGNHDNRSVMLEEFEIESPFIHSAVDFGQYRCLFLDTLDPGNDSGFMCPERLTWLEAEVSKAGERPIIIVMHHPPCDIGDPILDPIKLRNYRELADVLEPANIAQIFFGHIHRNLATTWNGIPAMSLAQPNRDLPTLSVELVGDRIASTYRASRSNLSGR
ncbi:metallophosphoesterase [Ruegeria arenilitoris]|uniref:metallophosphoesterase n=1 Tax=Ruegeria arenilitoris TaxID=1173585 RepID=UPI00147C3763|nr:metallophosphoesterase [Ruegeria arenilitoris]